MIFKFSQKPTMPIPDGTTSNVSVQTKPQMPVPDGTTSEPMGVKDMFGQVWPVNSNMGKMLVNTAISQGTKPDYVYNIEQAVSPAQTPSSVSVHDLPPVKRTPINVKIPAVAEMQQAIIALSKDIASQDVLHSAKTDGNLQQIEGADPFLNFLVTNYMQAAPKTGQQVVSGDMGMPIKQETTTKLENFKGMLNTLKNIGSRGSEQTPDGIWGFRTNNALNNIYALAYTLMHVQKDINIEPSIYTEEDLIELHDNIPEDSKVLTTDQKVLSAIVITKNLNKFRAVYDSFREKVLNNPTLKSKITQEQPLLIKKPVSSTTPLSQYERDLYSKYKTTELNTIVNGQTVTVMPFNLFNIDNFKKYLKSKAPIIGLSKEELDAIQKSTPEGQMLVNKFLTEIANSMGQE